MPHLFPLFRLNLHREFLNEQRLFWALTGPLRCRTGTWKRGRLLVRFWIKHRSGSRLRPTLIAARSRHPGRMQRGARPGATRRGCLSALSAHFGRSRQHPRTTGLAPLVRQAKCEMHIARMLRHCFSRPFAQAAARPAFTGLSYEVPPGAEQARVEDICQCS